MIFGQRRLLRVPALVVLATQLTGCCVFMPHTQDVHVSCNPTDATLMINGQHFQTPATVTVPRNREVSIKCTKEGYYTYDRLVGTHMNPLAAVDLVGTLFLLFPVIGLISPGANSLDQTVFKIDLTKQ